MIMELAQLSTEKKVLGIAVIFLSVIGMDIRFGSMMKKLLKMSLKCMICILLSILC